MPAQREYRPNLAESIESRLARLEREVAFLKAQGLSREEQSAVFGDLPKGKSYPVLVWLLSFVILVGSLLLIWHYVVQHDGLRQEQASGETSGEPIRTESFALPSSPTSQK